MKQQIVAGILAVSIVGGAGTAYAVHEIGGDDGAPVAGTATTPTPGASTSPTPSSTSKTPTLPTVPLGTMRITAGGVGSVSVGMSKQDAYATGYFDADVTVPQCDRVDDLVWKSDYKDVLDVMTADDGTIVSIGVWGAGPRTRSGLGVGSTYEEVRDALGGVEPVEAGYGQTGVYVQDGTGWIGFLFDPAPAKLQATSKVSFIEVTRGARPDLMRDGC